MNREVLVAEMIELLPEFKGREQELKDIIDKLVQSRPDSTMDENFKEDLRKKVLAAAEKNKRKIVGFRKALLLVVPAAAAAGLALYLTLGISLNQPESADNIQSLMMENEISALEKVEAPDDSTDKGVDLSGLVSDTEVVVTLDHSDEAAGKEGQTPPVILEQAEAVVEVEDVVAMENKKDRSSMEEAPIMMSESTAVQPADKSGYLDRLFGGAETEEVTRMFQQEPTVTQPDFNTEEFSLIKENDFFTALTDPVSTFSIDVDTASYSNTRRYLLQGSRPPVDAVRIEELINYFDYGYPRVTGEHPFAFNTALSSCPWNEDSLLLYVGVQGKRMAYENLPANNLVFLLDVSGSMSDENKLPLLKKSLELLTRQLRPQDRVSIVVYAGAAGVVLEPTEGNRTEEIIAAFDRLEAGGSTAGGEGIELAYKLAESHFMDQGNNRIIIATDGDFNVGPSSTSETTRLIEKKRDKGIFLTVLGFGMGNYKDSRMEQMADQGNGNYAYIDNILEAKKVLVNEISSTLFTIASDVKIQIEFNPYLVDQYRLIGYENRVMANQDFNDDKKDAGELGAGHSVTAIYEIKKATHNDNDGDELKYQDQNLNEQASSSGEVMTIKFRYKNPGADQSTLIEEPVPYLVQDFQTLNGSFQFAAAVAQWGMLLRNSEYKGNGTYEWVKETARHAEVEDLYGLKGEFLNLVDMSEVLR